MNPLISIIVPCYGQAQYLDECLQSVLDQTYQNWECIIVNDGSTDHTEEVAQQWAEKDIRFLYLYKENGGLSSARNAGIETAKGEWILPLDADDKIGSRYLELAEKKFNQGYTVIYCKARKFGLLNEEWDLANFTYKALARTNIIFCTAFFRKKDCEKVGGYDLNMKHGLEDWEFWISILKNGGKVFRIDDVYFYYRIKDNSMITELDQAKKNTMLFYIEQKHLDFFHQHLGSIHYLNHQMEKNIQKAEFNSNELKKILNSKRYKLTDKIFSLFYR